MTLRNTTPRRHRRCPCRRTRCSSLAVFAAAVAAALGTAALPRDAGAQIAASVGDKDGGIVTTGPIKIVPPVPGKDGKLGYAYEGLTIPPVLQINRTPSRTVQLLGEALARSSGPVRAGYATEVGACKSPEGLPLLTPALSDPGPGVRAAGARAVGAIGDPAGIPLLAPLVDDSDPTVRREAILASAALGDEAAVAKGLDDAHPLVVRAALSVARPAHAAAIAALLPKLPPGGQPAAAAALGRVGDGSRADVLVPLLASDDIPAKAAAARALGQLKATALAAEVQKLLADPHPIVRRAAVEAGAGVLEPAARQQMAIKMLADADPTVRETAAYLLAAVPTPDAIAPLVEQLGYGYEPLHLAARAALLASGPLTIDAAAKLLDHPDPRRREDGSYLLGELRNDANLTRHIALMEDKDWGVVRQVAWSLGLIGRTEAVPAIAKLAARGPQIHVEAAGAGGGSTAIGAVGNAIVSAARFRHAPTLPAVADLLNDRPTMMDPGRPVEVRAATYYLFGVVGDASDTDTCSKLIAAHGNIFENPLVKLEALKGLGHLRYEPAANHLLKVAESEEVPALRYIGHWAYQQVTGKTIPLEVPVVSWHPQVSINDATDQEQAN